MYDMTKASLISTFNVTPDVAKLLIDIIKIKTVTQRLIDQYKTKANYQMHHINLFLSLGDTYMVEHDYGRELLYTIGMCRNGRLVGSHHTIIYNALSNKWYIGGGWEIPSNSILTEI